VDAERAFLERAVLREWVESRLARWCPHKPTEKQLDALIADDFELFYGGAMGGGKSDFLLMRAAMQVDNPEYCGLILRRSFAELMLPNAILDRAKKWWIGKRGVRFDAQNKAFRWDSGAVVVFGYCDDEGDEKRYDGTEFTEAMFDEVQEFEWSQYQYIAFQRVRKTRDKRIKTAVRTSGMPGGTGHLWVKERFVTKEKAEPTKPWRAEWDMVPAFIPATNKDNPHLDASYTDTLARLDAFTRKQRGDGDWDIAPDGAMFEARWFRIVHELPHDIGRGFRTWDLARSEKKKNTDPDFTASCLSYRRGRDLYIADATEDQLKPGTMQDRQVQLAHLDGYNVAIRAEEEKAAAGAHLTAAHKRGGFSMFDYDGVPVTGDKITRARPLSIDAEHGHVFLVHGPWNAWWISRMVQFPVGRRDTTDAASLAHFCQFESAIGVPTPHPAKRKSVTSTLWADRRKRVMC